MLYLKIELFVYIGNFLLMFFVYLSFFSYLYMYKDNIKQLKDICYKYIYIVKKKIC